jgi:hypothetical protein
MQILNLNDILMCYITVSIHSVLAMQILNLNVILICYITV